MSDVRRRLVRSSAFARARIAAAGIAADPVRLRELVADVDRAQVVVGVVRDLPGGVQIDIACAVAEAHAEDLDTGDADRSAVGQARLRLVVAALCYLVRPGGRVADVSRRALLEDLELVDYVVTSALYGDAAGIA